MSSFYGRGYIDGGGSGGSGSDNLTKITYAELKGLRDNANLTPGMQYRITDYICTVANDENSMVESHPYDIIITADSESVLNENVRACEHDGDTYYNNGETTNAVLENWALKYCIDNDTNRFQWADTENGKGVVYYLKDDRNNECWYDFKQIKFKRFEITAHTKVSSLVGKYVDPDAVTEDMTVDEQNPKWFFTFSYVDEENNNSIKDSSIRSGEFGVFNNNISVMTFFEGTESYSIGLSRNVLISTYCYSNTFKDNCCYNTFGDSCSYITFGGSCYANTFGDNCCYNTFGDSCSYITFGGYCNQNIFLSNCNQNTFGYGCNANTFGDNCTGNIFCNYCGSNTFGNDCNYLDFSTVSTQRYNVLSGVFGTEQSHTVLQTTANNSFVTYVGKNSSGVLKYYNPMDDVI